MVSVGIVVLEPELVSEPCGVEQFWRLTREALRLLMLHIHMVPICLDDIKLGIVLATLIVPALGLSAAVRSLGESAYHELHCPANSLPRVPSLSLLSSHQLDKVTIIASRTFFG